MKETSSRHHNEISLAGLRAQATAVGLIQLIQELQRSKVLDDVAVARIRDAIVDDLALGRPLHASNEEFSQRLRARLDRLLNLPSG